MQGQLKDFDNIISHNLDFFKGPNGASRSAIEKGAVLTLGPRKIPNAADLRSPALQLSDTLVGSFFHIQRCSTQALICGGQCIVGFARQRKGQSGCRDRQWCLTAMRCSFPLVTQDLDEVQAYILLRRWQADHKDVVIKDRLTLEQLHSLAQAYFLERSYAIESLKLILQVVEGGSLIPHTS